MKRISLFVVVFTFLFISVNAQSSGPATFPKPLMWQSKLAKSDTLMAIMKKYTDAGLPGVTVAIYSEKEGWWAGSGGYSRVEDKLPMTNGSIQYLQSISKTYMAVAILKLYEQGKLKLDAPITNWLSKTYSRSIKDADKITIRMLLNHTSGIPEYSDDPKFVTLIMEHPLRPFTTTEALNIIRNRELLFTPGSRHSYSNTNYELLALIADAITGDHAKYISKNIFEPLDLKYTYYRNDPDYLKYPKLVNSYWDVLNTGKPANITAIQKTNVSSFIGDDGIVCTATDAVKFLRGLVEGKLLSASTLAEMKTWVKDDQGNPVYGLGLVHYAAGGLEGYGHSGGGIGGGCILIYIPEKKLYVFMATNIGTLFEGTLPAKANQLKDEILFTLVQ